MTGHQFDEREPETRAELLDRAAAYAETVDIDVDVTSIEWKVSERAKRRAGSCRYEQSTEQITISLTWAAYRKFGWEEFTETIRHELVHAWEFSRFGESGHGPRFEKKAREVDAPRHCRKFTDGRLAMVCTNDDCDWRPERHRASTTITHPDRGYRCGDCGCEYYVLHVASGRTWRTNDGYERARRALGDEW